MPSHKFKIGDMLSSTRQISSVCARWGFFRKVTRQPPGDGEREYRIKSANEPHERVARESELIKA
jgi:hypothetical protein